MRRVIPAAGLLLLLLVGVQAQKRAFTIADLYQVKGVSDPQISPDGQQIAFVVSVSDMEKGSSNSDIYLIDADGGHLRQLTHSDKADYHPRWSPDGKTLMFISTRSEGAQIWLMPASLGDARQLTHISTGISDALWSPDGQRIVFATDVFPECGADDACNKKIQEALDKGPLQAHMADRLLYRHWDFWKDGKATHTMVINVADGNTTDLTPGDNDSPGFILGGGIGFDISPDGKEVCFISKRVPDKESSTNMDLWTVPISGGTTTKITDNPAYDGNPQYSPDGRYIAYLKQEKPGFESDLFRLAVYDRQRHTHQLVLPTDFDNWVTDFCWAPDSKSIYFTAPEKGYYPVFRVDLVSGKVARVLDGNVVSSLKIAPDGKWLTFTRSSVGEPVELYRVDSDGTRMTRLTSENQALADAVDIRPAETRWVKGADGADIQVFIVKPHNFDPAKKYPLIVNVHGGPQMMWADSFRGDWQVYPGAGYVVAFPNPHGSTGYGQAFTSEISKDWGGEVMVDVLKVTDDLANLPYIDRTRMGAMGWSWGGYAMMWLEGHEQPFKCLASMMGVYDLRAMYSSTEEIWFPSWDLGGPPWESDLYQKFSPSNFVTHFKTPCQVITGEQDFRVPYTQSLEFFTDLQKMGVPSRLIVFKNDGHWPNPVKSMPFYYNAHLDWFHKYLGGDPAPYDMEKMWRNQAFGPYADKGEK